MAPLPRHTARVALAAALSIALTLPVLLAGQGRGGRGGAGVTVGGGRQGRGQMRDAFGQTPVGTGTISGSVVAAGSGSPVRRARVSLTGAELHGGRFVLTDDAGRFTFLALPAGRFSLNVSKAGYLSMAFGASQPGRPGTPIELADGQQIDRVTLTLPRGGVVTGTVLDEHGEPSPGTPVRAMRVLTENGERRLRIMGQDQTDDRGIYRIYDLQPGEYIVSAVPRNIGQTDISVALAAEMQAVVQQAGDSGNATFSVTVPAVGPVDADRIAMLQAQLARANDAPNVAYAPVYYPGALAASTALTIPLAAGEERAGIDFQLQLVPTARVEGRVVNADGTIPSGAQVALSEGDSGLDVPGIGMNVARVGPDGRFSFSTVAPGRYTVEARAIVRRAPDGSTEIGPVRGGRGGRGGRFGAAGDIQQVLWASADLGVNGQDVSGLVLTLQPGMTMTGRVDFESARGNAPADLSSVRLQLVSEGGNSFAIGRTPPPATVDATGRFTITGIAPGRYSVTGGVMRLVAPSRIGLDVVTTDALNPGGAQAAPASWTMKSAIVNGRDILDFPIDIGPGENASNVVVTFTDHTQQLSGTILDASGQPESQYTILVFPSDERYWPSATRRVRSTRPSTTGSFQFRGLPAGNYYLTAVTDIDPATQTNPAILEQLAKASISISIKEGEQKVQDIRVAN
jgi:protocatechuate 3,4-dioxygenase beta subunit